MSDTDALVIGAGPAGLACAAMLGEQGLRSVILEKAATVGAVWRRHYDRLHLHTDRGHSGLPGLPMPRDYPRYPSRAQVVAYLESYAAHFELRPEFGSAARAVLRTEHGWRVETPRRAWNAPIVVIATGWADFPHVPAWPGQAQYRGDVIHSSSYRNPAPYAGRRVLVVGFGNSGGEIALDLADAGVDTTLAVRSPVCILPRELLGLPILTWAVSQAALPPALADALNAPAIRLAVGSIERLGLVKASKGPRRMIAEDRKIPLLDIGTVAAIRAGRIKVRGGIGHFTAEGVAFEPSPATGGKAVTEAFDAVILATGFRPDLRTLLPGTPEALDAQGQPRVTGAAAAPGLFFCGQSPSPTGQLREIGIEARRIARLAAALPR
ncbi:cation diffusion facilitator CzcD-associated flavoprotein CzcO [Dyella sp. SG562]|uniref:flavin-containing monooxygenase n=1 Tax=Dyella sp. SG562 TaxID=2587017 RepID=UPI00141ECA47|nr:NAD(P)/FAD-dependent oxidoreductase [Dyella sp. SG562]NII73120.1 cation diffusion facilitator CzcD-associated flavoprotein CzcO [Dyella sp. SG562]